VAGSSNQYVYQLGSTLLAVPTGPAVQVTVPRGTNGVYFGLQSGQTLAIANQIGASIGNSYVMGPTERMNIDGPATFFLAAGGATAVVGIVWKYSSGYSIFP